MAKECCQEKRIIELEKKVEYMEKVIQALIRWKKDKDIDVIRITPEWKELVWYQNAFEKEMEKVWSYSQYWWE